LEKTYPIKKENRFRPKKRLGQHFIKDKQTIDEIIRKAGFSDSDTVLEIGPGLGALTIPLAGTVNQVLAVEKDSVLTRMLKERLERAAVNNVVLFNGDILKLDFSEFLSPGLKRIKIIGNLPYNISSPFLERLIKYRNIVSRAVLMFQSEFARRLIASPGEKNHGALSILIQYQSRVFPLLEVSKEVFHPRPKIDSIVLGFDFREPYPRRAEDEDLFKIVVKGAFAHKRKTLYNSLRINFSSCMGGDILKALGKCAIDPGKRAEALGIDDFLRLASSLKDPLTSAF